VDPIPLVLRCSASQAWERTVSIPAQPFRGGSLQQRAQRRLFINTQEVRMD
jgi:hypothetical protein